jgi:hypothetical protein
MKNSALMKSRCCADMAILALFHTKTSRLVMSDSESQQIMMLGFRPSAFIPTYGEGFCRLVMSVSESQQIMMLGFRPSAFITNLRG